MALTSRIAVGLLMVPACLAGCAAPEEKLFPVEGQVTFAGRPLGAGVVVLVADKDNDTTHEPRGTIDAAGNYKISTALKPGAPAGWYKVAVRATKASDPKKPYAIPESILPQKFANAHDSNIFLEVVANPAPAAYDIQLPGK